MNINDAVRNIKNSIEAAIKSGGVVAKNNLIRSQGPINFLHEAAKTELINHGVHTSLIKPAYGQHAGELKLAGFFKCKDQDICVTPNNLSPHQEILSYDGILKGTVDQYGQKYTEHILSINVRSQLSSIAKNFDTLYERTIAEASNLHLRCPNMVLGEFYMIPVYEYDDALACSNVIRFKQNRNIEKHIQKYIYAFNAINNRMSALGEDYKYERVCLLIVDFNAPQPKIYNTDAELKADGLIPANTTASIDNMNFPSFVSSLLAVYDQRFGADRLR